MGTTKTQTKRHEKLRQPLRKEGKVQHSQKRKPKGVDELPGVQKIKSSIRQTKRLLEKVIVVQVHGFDGYMDVFTHN
jgi:hypothetical protein